MLFYKAYFKGTIVKNLIQFKGFYTAYKFF